VPSFKRFTPLRYLPWWRCVASFIGYVTRRDEKMSWYLVGMPVSTKPVRLGQSHLVVGVACSQSGYEVSAARAGVASCGYLLRDRTRGRVASL